MSRLIFVPQFPANMRYQQWWASEFPKEFRKHYDEVVVLGEKWLSQEKANSFSELFKGMFSPIDISIQFETVQIMEYLSLKLLAEDVLFLADLSFPGFFANVLYHKHPKKCFAFCHASSKNNYDYFQPVRDSKWQVECGHAKLFDTIFVGSHYHKKKLGLYNVIVSGVPKPPFQTYKEEKIHDIISVSRPNIQKVNKKFEKKIERNFGKIVREDCKTWDQYYKFLSNAKVVLFSGKEDTFSYSILESVMNNSIPIAPNKFSYPELLQKEYLYNNLEEAQQLIWHYLKRPEEVPKIQCMDLVDNFYKNVVDVMKE